MSEEEKRRPGRPKKFEQPEEFNVKSVASYNYMEDGSLETKIYIGEPKGVVETQELDTGETEQAPIVLPEQDLDGGQGSPPDKLEGEPESAEVVNAESELSSAPVIEINGWSFLTDTQQNGEQFIVSEEPQGEGVLAFFRKTRKMEHFKWIESGKWSDTVSQQTLAFEPKYYKAKNA